MKLILGRDSRDISDLRRLDLLPKIMRYIASIAGKELVLNNMATDIKIPRSTLDPYVNLLETLYLIKRLDSWSNNLTSRVIDNKKAVIIDSGLATYLSKGKADLGGIFELFLAGEILKEVSFASEEYRIFHFRDYSKREIDIVIENEQNEFVPVEIKLSSTPSMNDVKVMREFKDKYGSKMKSGIVLYTGAKVQPAGHGIAFMPASNLWGEV